MPYYLNSMRDREKNLQNNVEFIVSNDNLNFETFSKLSILFVETVRISVNATWHVLCANTLAHHRFTAIATSIALRPSWLAIAQ